VKEEEKVEEEEEGSKRGCNKRSVVKDVIILQKKEVRKEGSGGV
jgi:hypothetical protein